MRVLAITLNTFREAVRNKILYSLLFFAVVFILSALALGELTLGEEVRLTRDLGLYGVDIFGVLIAIFLGVNLLYKELQLKTVYTGTMGFQAATSRRRAMKIPNTPPTSIVTGVSWTKTPDEDRDR